MQADNPGGKFSWQHFAVITAGLVVFVLLILADKTNLNSDAPEAVSSGQEKGVSETSGDSPAASPLAALIGALPDSLQQRADALRKSDTVSDSGWRMLVEDARVSGRVDAAAVLAAEFAELRPGESKYRLVAGALCRNAALLDEFGGRDSSLFRALMDEAIRQLETAEMQDTTSEDIRIELGLAYVQSNRPENSMKGILKIRRVLEMNPENEEAAYHLGQFAMETGQFEKAEERFRKVVEVNPRNQPARYSLALALEKQSRRDEARKLMEEVAAQKDYPDLAILAGQWLHKK